LRRCTRRYSSQRDEFHHAKQIPPQRRRAGERRPKLVNTPLPTRSSRGEEKISGGCIKMRPLFANTKELPNDETGDSATESFSTFGLRISFVIFHSSFVIPALRF
jgi:hypothetical protein